MNENPQGNGQELPSTFSQLVIMIATSALQQLGQVPDPSGKQSEVNLDGAQGMIDILEALNTKTKGNLDEGEKKIIDESLTMLRMQYVEIAQAQGESGRREVERQPSNEGAAPADTPPQGEQAKPEPDIAQPGSEPEQKENKTRYRKSYG